MAVNFAVVDTSSKQLVLHGGEKVFSTHANVQLSLESGGGYPGHCSSWYADAGIVFLTNLRVVYATDPPLPHFKTLELPLPSLASLKLVSSFFGSPREVSGIVKPTGVLKTPGELKLKFHEGAGEFHSLYRHLLSLGATIGAGESLGEQLPAYQPPEANRDEVLIPVASSSRSNNASPQPPQLPKYE